MNTQTQRVPLALVRCGDDTLQMFFDVLENRFGIETTHGEVHWFDSYAAARDVHFREACRLLLSRN